MRQPPNHRVPRDALASAAAAPAVGLDDPAGKDCSIRIESLAGDFEAELVEPAERGQIRAGEAAPRGSVRHVEVFRMRRVGTFISGDLDPYPLTAAPTRRTP
jgi:hypothetical protein